MADEPDKVSVWIDKVGTWIVRILTAIAAILAAWQSINNSNRIQTVESNQVAIAQSVGAMK